MTTHAETMLSAIESVLEGRITSDVEQYSIEGRQLTKIPIAELVKLRDRYKREVFSEEDAERIKLGLGSKRKIRVRF